MRRRGDDVKLRGADVRRLITSPRLPLSPVSPSHYLPVSPPSCLFILHPSSFRLTMSRPLLMSLFDASERRPLSVSELTSQVRGAIENRFASVWVEGEISNFRTAASGHWYFTVRDEGAQLRTTCFRGVNCRIRFRPSDGLLVRVRGRMTVHEPRGDYELMVEALDPVGAGALRVAFEQLKERLAAEGLFDEALKRELPILPRR